MYLQAHRTVNINRFSIGYKVYVQYNIATGMNIILLFTAVTGYC